MILLVWSGTAQAQESFRSSLASADAAEARKRALEDQRFNVELGRLGLRFGAGVETEANDNVFATSEDPESDLIFRPRLNLASVWRVSERNSLNLGVGFGYAKYLNSDQLDNFFISPGSDLGFVFYAGDFKFDLHSRFSYSQDVVSDPTISGVGALNRFQNSSGLSVQWDLNQVVLGLNYDHLTYQTTDAEFAYLDHVADVASFSAAFEVVPRLFFAGLQIGGGFLDYSDDVLDDNNHLAIGPFFRLRVSDHSSMELAGGYTIYYLDSTTRTNSSDSLDSFYFSLRFRHRLSRALSHSLVAGQQVQSGFSTSTYEMLFVRHEANWQILQKTSLSTWVSYETVPRSSGDNQVLDRYGFGVRLGRSITERIGASLEYQFYYKLADDNAADYQQNRLVLSFGYRF